MAQAVRKKQPLLKKPNKSGGGGWESNPPGTLLSPTLVLKTRAGTSLANTSGTTLCVTRRGATSRGRGGSPTSLPSEPDASCTERDTHRGVTCIRPGGP